VFSITLKMQSRHVERCLINEEVSNGEISHVPISIALLKSLSQDLQILTFVSHIKFLPQRLFSCLCMFTMQIALNSLDHPISMRHKPRKQLVDFALIKYVFAKQIDSAMFATEIFDNSYRLGYKKSVVIYEW